MFGYALFFLSVKPIRLHGGNPLEFEVMESSEGAGDVLEPETQEYGGSTYTCCDPEGYIWNIGSYDPWHDND